MVIGVVMSAAVLAVLGMVVTSLAFGGQLVAFEHLVLAFHWRGEVTPQALGGVVVGAVAFVTAVWAIRTTRWATRAKATVDFIERLESQEIYRQRSARYRCFRRGCITLDSLEEDRLQGAFANRDLVHGHLNRWEFAGTACRRGLFDVRVMRSISATEILRDWAAARELIDRRRGDQRSAYETFEWLARHCRLHARGGAAAAPAAPTPCGAGRASCAGEAAALRDRAKPPADADGAPEPRMRAGHDPPASIPPPGGSPAS
jgi:hypothetical protein